MFWIGLVVGIIIAVVMFGVMFRRGLNILNMNWAEVRDCVGVVSYAGNNRESTLGAYGANGECVEITLEEK